MTELPPRLTVEKIGINHWRVTLDTGFIWSGLAPHGKEAIRKALKAAKGR
jgi:hypothetical protein